MESLMKKSFSLTITTVFILIFFLLFSAFCWAQDTNYKQSSSDPLFSSDYIIGCGDILKVLIWKEPDLTREVFVRLDGKITFPLLDDIPAAGKTTMQLKKEIQDGLDKFVESPFVTVTLIKPESQKFYILGEVARTGEYEIRKKLTVLQAFALAGGFTEWASKKEIILLREENGTQKILRVNYKDIVKGESLDMNVTIQTNDTIIVP